MNKSDYKKDWYLRNRESHLAKCRERYAKNKQEKLECSIRWQKANPGLVKKYQRDYALRHPEKMARKQMAHRQRVKLALFGLLGTSCARCGFSDMRALQIDHIHGCPVRVCDRRKFRESGITFFKQILRGERDKSIYQVLCANCNWIKRSEDNKTGSHKVNKCKAR